jgi:hypothetical protein
MRIETHLLSIVFVWKQLRFFAKMAL